MSIEHKAYLFRYDQFQKELAQLLYHSLEINETEALHRFIELHRESLADQGTEEPLGENWAAAFRKGANVQDYADLALTRYYDVTGNEGLSYGWEALGEYLDTVSYLPQPSCRLYCGTLFGPIGNRLDPGRMGTGLVSAQEVAQLTKLFVQLEWPKIPNPRSKIYKDCYYRPNSHEEVQDSLNRLLELYRWATKAKVGLLFADFNDCGVSHL